LKAAAVKILLSILITAGFFVAWSSRVEAAAPEQKARIVYPPQATVLRIVPIPPAQLGHRFDVTAVLTTAKGEPVADNSVNFLVGGVFVGQSRTDAEGRATITIINSLATGNYTLKAVFQGARQYEASSGTQEFSILSGVVTVQAVPPVPGVPFRLGGQVFATGDDGIAQVEVTRVGTYTLEVLQLETPDNNMRAEFNRWLDDVYVPYRDVEVPTDKPLQVGLQVSYRIGQTFIDLQNQPVDPSRITAISLKSSQGTSYTFNDGSPRWLPASLVTRRVGGLEVVEIQYSVMSVVVDGSNVVSQAQQRFFGHPGDTWPIQLLLFSAKFSARDAFLGFPVGDGVILEYPDGTRQKFDFGEDDSITISSLARGIYHVQVTGVSGLTPSTPVALSQNQDMQLSILTRLDIFMAATSGTLFALSLIMIGRTRILSSRRRKMPAYQGQQAPNWSSIREQ